MDTLEIIVFLAIAIIVGGLFITFITDWDVKETYETLKSVFIDKDETVEFEKVDKIGFIKKLHNSWEECGLGEKNETYTFYVKPDDNSNKDNYNILTKEFIFEELKKINYCNSLQSQEFECGTREDVDMEDINLPSVITVSCIDGIMEVK